MVSIDYTNPLGRRYDSFADQAQEFPNKKAEPAMKMVVSTWRNYIRNYTLSVSIWHV